jgi:hypothetical protein
VKNREKRVPSEVKEERVQSEVKEERAPKTKRRSASIAAVHPRDGNEAQTKEGAVQKEGRGVPKGGKEAEAQPGGDKVYKFNFTEDFLN